MKRTFDTIVFDFDGTLADSLRVMLRAYASISESFHLRDIATDDIAHLRGMTIAQVIRSIGLPVMKLPFFLYHARKKYREFLDDIEPFPGIPFVLMELRSSYPLHILTSNDTAVVRHFIDQHNIDLFSSVTSERNIFGKDQSLRKLIKRLGLSSERVLYVGDEVRDIVACKKAQIPVCAVTWGLNSRELLERYRPDYLIDQPEELLALLRGEKIIA